MHACYDQDPSFDGYDGTMYNNSSKSRTEVSLCTSFHGSQHGIFQTYTWLLLPFAGLSSRLLLWKSRAEIRIERSNPLGLLETVYISALESLDMLDPS